MSEITDFGAPLTTEQKLEECFQHRISLEDKIKTLHADKQWQSDRADSNFKSYERVKSLYSETANQRDALQKALDEMAAHREAEKCRADAMATVAKRLEKAIDESRALVEEFRKEYADAIESIHEEWGDCKTFHDKECGHEKLIAKAPADALRDYRARVGRETLVQAANLCAMKAFMEECADDTMAAVANAHPYRSMEKQIRALAAEGPKCVCGDKTSQGVIHRTDGPCYQEGPREVPK